MEIRTNFYTYTPLENMLLISSYGSWDERVVKDFSAHGQALAIQHFTGRPWAILHDGSDWELGTPGTESMIRKLLNTRLTHTLTHHAFVTGPSEMKKWQIKQIFDGVTAHETKIFERLEDAEQWLLSFGYAKNQ